MLGNDARPCPKMHEERSRRPNHRPKNMYRWDKDEEYRKQMFTNGRSKEELQSWDAQMREGLGDHAEYHQPRQLREQIHLGRLKIRQSANVALPVKQHNEYHLAVTIVRGLEQEQRIAGGNSMQDEQQAHPSSLSSSQWDGCWTSSWWDKSWQWTAISSPRWF